MEKWIHEIIEAAQEVHRHLGGPGLMENIYETALAHELGLRGLNVKRQLPIPVIYKSTAIRDPLFLDLLVEDEVIVEIKATAKECPYYHAQLATHLRLSHKKWGLLINFGKDHLMEGVHRMIHEEAFLQARS